MKATGPCRDSVPVWMGVDSPLGRLALRAEGGCLTGLYLPGQRHAPAIPPALPDTPGDPSLRAAARWLEAYFAGRRPEITVPLAPAGTPFQQAVWQALTEIPYGETVSYGALAARLSSAPRAVGGAVGRNPISILIPCHRVVGADGRLTGYAGGLAAKEALLRLETAQGIDNLEAF